MDTKGGTLGGGEVLDYMDPSNFSSEYARMDNGLISMFEMLGLAKFVIIVLIIVIAMLIVFKLLKIKSPFKGKGIVNELDHMEEVRKHDEAILRVNKFIKNITSIIEHSPLAISKHNKDYIEYNLVRADIRIPGGVRTLKSEEYNALLKSVQVILFIVGLAICILVNYLLGGVIMIATLVFGNTLPMMYIRGIVQAKDQEIEANFSDFYLMIHYVLMARANTPLSGIMKSYDKTTNSKEMHKFVDVCISNIDTYGEYEGPAKIADRYREIPVVVKLMRLIKQANEGADVAPELKGFRDELINAKRYALQLKNDKIIAKARASFGLLMPILIQAIISAMAIYFDDISIAGSFF